MGDREALAMIDAAYAFDRAEDEWVRGVVDAARAFDLGHGVGAYIAELGARIGVRALTFELRTPVPGMPEITGAMSPRLWGQMHKPIPTSYVADVYNTALQEGLVSEEFRTLFENGPRAWGVIGGDPAHETFLLMLPCDDRKSLTQGDRAALDCVGAHLGAALRLRGMQARAPHADDHGVEAVVTPGGKLLDLRGPEAEASSRTLVETVQKAERARTRKASPEERLATWTALVEGRWSIVETTESDGKRMLLAVKNEPRTANIRKLTSRERSAASYAALGHSYKYIAYELGIKAPTVSALVKGALRKLGLKSRADLIRVFG
jgi:DNA-binding CsgD family transcriptional regulator